MIGKERALLGSKAQLRPCLYTRGIEENPVSRQSETLVSKRT